MGVFSSRMKKLCQIIFVVPIFTTIGGWWRHFSISYLILSEAADQDGRFDTLISSLGQLVVELLSFVFKHDRQTDKQTN